MLCGLDQLFSSQFSVLRKRLRSSRVGILTHAAAVDRRGRSALTVLDELGASPSLVFAPEHGLSSVAQAEEAVAGEDAGDQLRLISLYGDTRESLTPRAEDLAEIDVLLIDLVDVGSRYYTYVWSALLAARAAAAAGKHCVVLDRPNPISGDPDSVEGASQAEGFLTFVGLEPLPIRHALTVGELVAMFMERDGHALGGEGVLSVVPTRGWERYRTASAWGRPFIMPSPNMPTLETALVYPGGCLVEGTNLSEGRGTTTPFQLVGAPFLDGDDLARALTEHGTPGAQVRPVAFKPCFEKHSGQLCRGVMLHVTNPQLFRPVATYLAMLALARQQAPDDFAFRTEPYEFETSLPAFDMLTGSAQAREALAAGASPAEVAELVVHVDPSWRDTLLQAEERTARASA